MLSRGVLTFDCGALGRRLKMREIKRGQESILAVHRANEKKETVNPLCVRGVLPDDGHGAAAGHGDREEGDEGRGEGEYLGV